jgi:hypothetical protein
VKLSKTINGRSIIFEVAARLRRMEAIECTVMSELLPCASDERPEPCRW